MSSRVHKVSEKWLEQRPHIMRLRDVDRRRRNGARNQERLQQFKAVRETIHASLEKRSRDELRKVAKDMEIKGSWRMTKPQLVEAIKERW